MNIVQSSIEALREKSHPRPDIGELELLFDQVDCEELIAELEFGRPKGPSGHSRAPMNGDNHSGPCCLTGECYRTLSGF